MLAAPVFAGDAHAALHFVKNQQNIVVVAQTAEQLKKFGSEMVVAAFALNWFKDNGGDVHGLLREYVTKLFFRPLFLFNDIRQALGLRQGKIQHGGADSRPRKFREIS